VGGRLIGPDVEFDGAAIDSRRVHGGELFVPIVAERDGHDFVGAALRAGAAAYLTSRGPVPGAAAPVSGSTAIVVDDTAEALADLGRRARHRLPDRVVGVTGSSGKTSTKDLLGAVVQSQGPSAVNEKSFNNELGLPLTLVNAPPDAHAAVLEMGARGPGHIRWLCEIARPTIGVVTNVSLSHTEFLGSIDGVAAAKSELVEALPPTGTAVLNAGDPRVAAMADRTEARVLTFGVDVGDVRATGVRLDADLRPSFLLESPWGKVDVELSGAHGAHQAANAAAAAGAALVLGISLEDVATAMAGAALSPLRMEVLRSAGGVVVLNDAYNANPASTEAALQALAATPVPGRRVAILGPMLELGAQSEPEHRRIAAVARSLGIELVAVGTSSYGVDPVADMDGVLRLDRGDAVLVKGSRAAGLERVAAYVVATW
jgi:UDP-N-acetylmuramoyl-tripeptide--D-alanyl-D-alanine ligase